jgi:hypothetical protein
MVVIPAARMIIAAVITLVFAFIHNMIFNVPFTSAKVELVAAVPLAGTAGATWIERT